MGLHLLWGDSALCVCVYEFVFSISVAIFSQVSLFFKSFPRISSVFVRSDELVDVVFPSPSWSSNTSVCSRRGFHLAALFVHLASGCDAILIANLHFIFLWVSIQR